jgi:hypothetical protein
MTAVEREDSLAKLTVVAGRSHPRFAAAVCEQLNRPPVKVRHRTFLGRRDRGQD